MSQLSPQAHILILTFFWLGTDTVPIPVPAPAPVPVPVPAPAPAPPPKPVHGKSTPRPTLNIFAC